MIPTDLDCSSNKERSEPGSRHASIAPKSRHVLRNNGACARKVIVFYHGLIRAASTG